MEKRTIRAFSLGLLLAAFAVAAFSFFTEEEPEAAGEDDAQEETAAAPVLESGQIAVFEQEYNALKDQVVMLQEQLEEASAGNEQTDGDNPVATRFILSVPTGMTAGEIGEKLEEFDLIERGRDLTEYVEDRGLENEIRPGEYEITSGLSIEEITAILTRS